MELTTDSHLLDLIIRLFKLLGMKSAYPHNLKEYTSFYGKVYGKFGASAKAVPEGY